MMFLNVVTSMSVLSASNDLDQVGATLALQMMVAGSHMFLVSLRTDTVWPAKNGLFLWQPHWS